MAELECVDCDQASIFRAIPVGIFHSNILPINREKVGKMNHVTLINPFEIPAGKEEQFVERWKQAAQYLRQREVFVSTRLHQTWIHTRHSGSSMSRRGSRSSTSSRLLARRSSKSWLERCPSLATPHSTGLSVNELAYSPSFRDGVSLLKKSVSGRSTTSNQGRNDPKIGACGVGSGSRTHKREFLNRLGCSRKVGLKVGEQISSSCTGTLLS